MCCISVCILCFLPQTRLVGGAARVVVLVFFCVRLFFEANYAFLLALGGWLIDCLLGQLR